jgi:rod shape-determining protein MreD
MKYRVMTALFLVLTAALLQSTLLGYIEIFSVRPNLLIVMTVVTALLRGTVESAIMGIAYGLTFDILLGKTLGWYALLLFLLAILISMVNEKLYREKVLVLLTFGLVSSILVETCFVLIYFLFRGLGVFPMLFSTIILPEALFNAVLILPLFKPVMKVYNMLDTIDRKRNRLS